MGLMTEIKIRNFMGFREPVSIKLSQSTYFVGANNSGKSTILKAMVCFFDSNEFRHDKLNKSEQASRGGGANRSEITVGFDLSLISIAKKKRLSRKYGDILEITKTFTVKEISRNIVVEYSCGNEKKKPFEELDADVQALLKAVRISYLHPQEGPELLLRAQSKFKERLFANWGRHASMAKNIGEAQAKWEELRTLATDYLSSALTESVQRLWPGSETKVDLPAKIEDVVGISDITFKNDKDQPAITLSEQGTGAQSSILYQTHYILDSDRTLHLGMYFPVWLLEEPESFLHSSLAAKLSKQLSSKDWHESMQMLISTHSPIFLAASKRNDQTCNWCVFDNFTHEQIEVKQIKPDEIRKIGYLLGDENFETYFFASSVDDLNFVEDTRQETIAALSREKITVKGTGGAGEIKNILSVLSRNAEIISSKITFIVDSDEGRKHIKEFLKPENIIRNQSGFRLYQIAPKLRVVELPDGEAVEDLFGEFANFVERIYSELYKPDGSLTDNCPGDLSEIYSNLKYKTKDDKDYKLGCIRKSPEVKRKFWKEFSQPEMVKAKKKALKMLIGSGGKKNSDDM